MEQTLYRGITQNKDILKDFAHSEQIPLKAGNIKNLEFNIFQEKLLCCFYCGFILICG